MKRTVLFVFSILIFSLLFSECKDKYEWKNPLDSQSDVLPEAWAPKNLQEFALNDAEIQLTWEQDEDRIEGFIIDSKSGSNDFTQLAKIPKTQTTLIDTALHFGTEYTYRICAYASDKKSNYWVSDKIKTFFPTPTELEAIALNDYIIQVNWKDNCAFESGFILERKEGEGVFSEIKQLPANSTTCNDSGLTLGESYQYRIKAYTELNNSHYTLSNSNNTSFPAPTNLNSTPLNDSEIKLTWNDNCSFEHGFRIERSNDGSNYIQVSEVQANINNYTDTGLIFGEHYYYRIYAYTSENQSDFSNISDNSTFFPAPSNLIITPLNDSEITLTWNDNFNFELGFKIERSKNSEPFTTIETTNPDVTSFTDNNLEYGPNYKYRIHAFTAINQSGYSNVEESITSFPAPTNLQSISQSTTEIILTWTDNCSFESGYRIERKVDDGDFEQISEVGSNTTQFSDNGATWDKDHTYRVYAFTQLNNSEYSDTSTINPSIRTAPTDLKISETKNYINISWTDSCDFEDGFHLERRIDGKGWNIIETLPANITEYKDSNVSIGTNYTYRVQAFISDKYTIFSNIYSIERKFGTVEDIDGNFYITVKIGNQIWMAENLRVVHYSDGDEIPNITNNSEWSNLTTGAYCDINNLVSYTSTYGKLYNFYAASDSRDIAIMGWHIPTDEEWKELEMYLGMSRSDADNFASRGTNEGGMLKNTGLSHWIIPNSGATNESGFSALPAGLREDYYGNFDDLKYYAYFWSATFYSSVDQAWYRRLDYDNSMVGRSTLDRQYGLSIRCVKD